MQQHIYYIKYALQFADMQIPELVNTFNQQVQSRAWSFMRSYHDKALLDEFQRRGIDTSVVSDGKAICFAHPICYDLPNNSLVTVAWFQETPHLPSALGKTCAQLLYSSADWAHIIWGIQKR